MASSTMDDEQAQAADRKWQGKEEETEGNSRPYGQGSGNSKKTQEAQGQEKTDGKEKFHDLAKKRFAESEIKKWKKMDKTTEDFLVEVLDEGISTIKTNSKKDQYSEINEQLKECRHRLVNQWKKLKTPKNTFGTYRGLQKLNVSYSSTLSDMVQHQEDLEIAVRKAEKSCKAMEKELEKRERCLEEGLTNVHPLLRADIQTVLNIPSIPRFVMES